MLQRTPLIVEAPHLYYPVVTASDDDSAAVAVYDANHVVHLPERDIVYLVNAAPAPEVVTVLPHQAYEMTVFDCMGGETESQRLDGAALIRLPIPPSGMALLRRRG